MKYNWVKYYEEFADKLLEYKNCRLDLIKVIDKVFDKTNLHHPTLESGELKDIDPFTVFGLFNKGLTQTNRVKIITAFKELFNMSSDVPDNFDGIPVLNNMMATFYAFQNSKNRNANDIQNLWDLYSVAINLASDDNSNNRNEFIRLYNIVHKQFAIKWNITMALFWIRPYFFINLDSRNRWFMEDDTRMPKEFVKDCKKYFKNPPLGEEYLKVRDAAAEVLKTKDYEYTDLVELSSKAFSYSEYINGIIADTDLDNEKDKILLDVTNYWIYSPGDNAEMWDEFYNEGIMAIDFHELGNLGLYKKNKDILLKMAQIYGDEVRHTNLALTAWQFSHDIKKGDIIFAKKGKSKIIGRGEVISNYQYLEDKNDNYRNIIEIKWTDKGEWDSPESSNNVAKTLTNITSFKDYVDKLNSLFTNIIYSDTENDSYTKEDFLKEVYITSEKYDDLVNALNYKQNIILQGAPGVGKTFIAKRLAYSMMGCKDSSRVQMVQFHQNYSYEDFIMGYKPTADGFDLQYGVFYNFCKKASEASEDYYFIIDEINRGNLSKIFGELFMLIEKDKRKVRIKLAYKDEEFFVPDNVYIIGMMNTADRSLAMVDYALRRRFDFIDLEPGFNSEGFIKYQNSLNNPKFNNLVRTIKDLNQDIKNDESLGDGYAIGHSFLCNLNEEKINNNRLTQIVEYEIIPLLKEYWFDNIDKVNDWKERLRSSVK